MEVTLLIAWVSRVEMDGKNLIRLGGLANNGKVTYLFGLTRTGGFGMRADGRVGDLGITHQLLVQHRTLGERTPLGAVVKTPLGEPVGPPTHGTSLEKTPGIKVNMVATLMKGVVEQVTR